jgi:hypothetical protein
MADELQALLDAAQAYQEAFAKEPKHRRALGHIQQLLYEAQRLTPRQETSPGRQAAFLAQGKVAPVSPPAPRSGPPAVAPDAYASAREAAAARLAEAG